MEKEIEIRNHNNFIVDPDALVGVSSNFVFGKVDFDTYNQMCADYVTFRYDGDAFIRMTAQKALELGFPAVVLDNGQIPLNSYIKP